MKKHGVNILLFLFMLVSCSEKGNDKRAEPLSGPHSEICIQYNSQEIQPYEMEGNDSLNDHLTKLLQSDLLIATALIKTGGKTPGGMIQEIKEKLTFENVEKTQLLMIHFYHSDEKFAKSFLKNLVDALSENLLASVIDESNKKLKKINDALDSLALDMHEYKTELMENPDMDETELQEARDYFNEYLELQKSKKVLITIKTCLERNEELCLSSATLMVNESDSFLKKALEEVYEFQKSKNELQCPKPGNKECETIDAKMEAHIKNIFIYLENSITATKAKAEMLQAKIKEIPKKNPNLARNNTNRIRKLNIDEKLYAFLIEKKTKLMIERAGFTPLIKILDGPIYKRE